jgi:hypothetical protein
MSKVRKCAYCQSEETLTREHIWPKCMLNRMPELNLKYIGSRNLLAPTELVISDVCAECNNKKLSVLDNYLCLLYDQSLKTFREDHTPFKFEYDYDHLLRVLLKLTYNSSRTMQRENNQFEKYREMILEGGVREDVIVKLDIVTPSIIDGEKIYPKSARIGSLQIPEGSSKFILRAVSVNSFYFYIILSKEFEVKPGDKDELVRVFHSIPGTVIHPHQKEILVDSFSGHNTESSHFDWVTKAETQNKTRK